MIGDLRRRLMVLAMISAAGFVTSGNATATVVSGYFNQPANVALFASDGYGDLRAARFGNDDEIARNFAEYELTVLTPGSLTFTSTGYSKLGAQPYFSLFSGSGTGATFLDSNYSIPDIDFTLTRALAIGSYTFTLGVWVNQSFAENNPGANPTLGAGFTALGDPSLLGNSYYELSITSANGGVFQIAPVPEPSTLYMFIAGLLALGAARSFRRQRSEVSRALFS